MQKELRNVKNVLRVPRLTEKYREALKQAERKDVIQYFIEDQLHPFGSQEQVPLEVYSHQALNSAIKMELGTGVDTSKLMGPDDQIQTQTTKTVQRDLSGVLTNIQSSKPVLGPSESNHLPKAPQAKKAPAQVLHSFNQIHVKTKRLLNQKKKKNHGSNESLN